jgi:hypothetical protein
MEPSHAIQLDALVLRHHFRYPNKLRIRKPNECFELF